MYSGFLLKIGNEIFNMKYIKEKTYKGYVSVQDLDSYRDANGLLHREALSHVPIKCEFETIPLNNEQYEQIMDMIRRNYINELERKVTITAFILEYNGYVTQDAYMAEPQPQIQTIKDNKIQYAPLRIAFIGY
jgi:hypothetical protein|nr:MAG TPA: hypothetical protein [Caudoviricetes sp.]DAN32376.1 MAG TPA: hypothetical protein [Caudoviricetes sp.]DAZ08195.1 MAG TPA: hypothetical protein [Caudoviricetes sp.]